MANDTTLDDITVGFVQRIQTEAVKGLKVHFRDVMLPKMIKDAAHKGKTCLFIKTTEIPSGLPHEYVNQVLMELEDRGFTVKDDTKLWKWWFVSWKA